MKFSSNFARSRDDPLTDEHTEIRHWAALVCTRYHCKTELLLPKIGVQTHFAILVLGTRICDSSTRKVSEQGELTATKKGMTATARFDLSNSFQLAAQMSIANGTTESEAADAETAAGQRKNFSKARGCGVTQHSRRLVENRPQYRASMRGTS